MKDDEKKECRGTGERMVRGERKLLRRMRGNYGGG
jgi:hypothetical protein